MLVCRARCWCAGHDASPLIDCRAADDAVQSVLHHHARVAGGGDGGGQAGGVAHAVTALNGVFEFEFEDLDVNGQQQFVVCTFLNN